MIQISASYSTDSIILFHKKFKEGVTKSPLWHIKKIWKLNKVSVEWPALSIVASLCTSKFNYLCNIAQGNETKLCTIWSRKV